MIIKLLYEYLKKMKLIVLFHIILMFCLWFVGISVPYISGIYIDYLVKGTVLKEILVFAVIILLFNLIKILCQYLNSLMATRLNNRLLYEISNDLYQKIFRSIYKKYSNTDPAYLVDQIGKDSGTMVVFFSSNVVNFVLQFTTVLLSAIIVLKADILLSIIIFSLIPIYIITYYMNKTRMYNSNAEYKQKNNIYFSKHMEQINKLEFIKENSLNAEMNKRLYNGYTDMLRSALKGVRANYLFTNLNQVVISAAYICIIAIGGYRVSTGSLSIGYFTIINTYFNMMISSVSYFLDLAGSYQDAKVSAGRILKVLDEEEETEGSEVLCELNTISIHNLSISFNEQNIVSDVNLKLHKGKLYGISGRNGCGKTTLLKAIIGLFPGDHTGEIFYDETEMQNLNLSKLKRDKISYLEQELNFLNMKANEYLQFGIDADEDILKNQKMLLKKFDAEYLLDKDINESGNNFSGGEKQKIALVRTLSKKSFLIILDEPTSALDKKSSELLMDILLERKKDAIIIMISHDLLALNCCDEIINLENKRIINQEG